jgi:hypothetical protein
MNLGQGVHTAIYGLTIIGVAMIVYGKADDTTIGLLIGAIAGIGGYHISKGQ